MTTKVKPLLTLTFQFWRTVRAGVQLVVQGAEQLLYQRVRILAVQEIRALVPAAVIFHIGTLVDIVKEEMRRTSEVLLAMGVVALRPLMLLVDIRAEARLIRIDHELVDAHRLLWLL